MKKQSISKLSGLCLAGVFMLSSCQDDAQVRAMSEQIRALEMAQGQAKAELSRVQLQMRSLQAERDKIKDEKEKLQLQIEEAKRAAESIMKDFEDYKMQYKLSIRKRAPGMELEVVEVDGKKFEKVRIRELTDTSLTFMHTTGTMSVELALLDNELATRLGYEKIGSKGAISAASNRSTDKIGLGQQATDTEAAIAAIRVKIAKLQTAIHEANRKVYQTESQAQDDPTPHRQAAAAFRVQLNEAEVELKQLVEKSHLITTQLRYKKPN
jgi:predicted  nucleic acid-binding Zn-ribbon protein